MTSSKTVRLEDPARTGQNFALMTMTENAEFGLGMLSMQIGRGGRKWAVSPVDKMPEKLTRLFGTRLVPTDKHSRHPDSWKPRANLATTIVTPTQAIAVLDEYLGAMREQEGVAVPAE